MSRITLLRTLMQRDESTVQQLVAATDLHANTVREHLQRLIDAGFVSSRPKRITRGRPVLLYSATVARDDRRVAERVEQAVQHGELVRKVSGREPPAEDPPELTRQLDVLDEHMERCGFDASVEPGGARLTMHSCPFEALAREHAEVCQVHFHLIDEALRHVDGPLEAGTLHSMDPVTGCSIELHDRRAAPGRE